MERMIPLEQVLLMVLEFDDATKDYVTQPFEALAQLLRDSDPGVTIEPQKIGQLLELMVEGADYKLQEILDQQRATLQRFAVTDDQEAAHE